MLWFYRFVCFLAIGVVIPMLRCVVQDLESLPRIGATAPCRLALPPLCVEKCAVCVRCVCSSRKNWIRWFHKDLKSLACTVHVGGLSGRTSNSEGAF